MRKIFSILLFTGIFFCQSVFADKIAVIGGGASGLVSAWLLELDHDVTLYEAQNRLGGHANSINVAVDGNNVAIEAGAEFFNEKYYPHFLKLLKHFNIPVRQFTSTTTFYTVDNNDLIILPPYHDGKVEWKSLTPSNISRSVQIKMVIDNGRKLIEEHNTDATFKEFIDTLYVSNDFKNGFLYPFIAAQWGVNPIEVQTLSAYAVLKFLVEGYDVDNYQWDEVTGGLKKYIEAVSKDLKKATIKLNARVKQIAINHGQYTVITEDGNTQDYDQIIFATEANAASSILNTCPETTALAAQLAKIQYYDTKIAIHSDPRFMSANHDDWRVVNIRYNGTNSATTIYKDWKLKTPIFKSWLTYDVRSINDTGNFLPSPLYALITYKHPYPNKNFFDVQKIIEQVQGNHKIWFAGMWTLDNGSHESAITSAINVAQHISPNAERLKVFLNK